MESKVEVKTYLVSFLCDECRFEMQKENYILPTAPPQYVYKCPGCGKKEQSFENYPKTVYEKQFY